METLFFREDTVKQFQLLQQGKNHLIQGPPGIGKSMLGLLKVLHYHFKKQQCVLYVTCSPTVVINVLFQENGCLGKVMQWEYAAECVIQDVMEAAYNFKEPSLLVIDGLVNTRSVVTGTNPWIASANLLLKKKRISQVILLSSKQLDLGEYVYDFILETFNPEAQSWTLEDFLTICLKEEHFWQMVLRTVPELKERLLGSPPKELERLTPDEVCLFKKSLVTEKFYFSGGSARWMFHFRISDIQDRSDKALAKVDNFSDLVKGDIGEGAPRNINRLYQTRVNEKGVKSAFFVSQYVSRKIFMKYGGIAADVMRAWADTMSNPSVKGWVYEAKFFACWKSCDMSLKLVYLDTILLDERAGGTFKSIIQEEEDPVLLQGRSLVPLRDFVFLGFSFTTDGKGQLQRSDKKIAPFKDLSCFVVPELWNQGLFDFAIALNKELFLIQCTLRDQHDRLISHIDPLVCAFEEQGFQFESFHLVGCSDKENFKFTYTYEVSTKARKIQCWRSTWFFPA